MCTGVRIQKAGATETALKRCKFILHSVLRKIRGLSAKQPLRSRINLCGGGDVRTSVSVRKEQVPSSQKRCAHAPRRTPRRLTHPRALAPENVCVRKLQRLCACADASDLRLTSVEAKSRMHVEARALSCSTTGITVCPK